VCLEVFLFRSHFPSLRSENWSEDFLSGLLSKELAEVRRGRSLGRISFLPQALVESNR